MSRSVTSRDNPVLHLRRSSRRSSMGSPARVGGRLSSLVQQVKDASMESFASTPGNSILSDNTDIEQPRRQSWWKKLDNNSRDIIEALGNEKVDEANNVLEDLDVEILSQEREKRNFSLDLPESSGSESIGSIIIPERKLFTQKENIPQKKFSYAFGPRESLPNLQKANITGEIKDINTMVGPKQLFGLASRDRYRPSDDPIIQPKKLFNQDNPQRKTIFPGVFNSSPKKSGDIVEPSASSKNLFPQSRKDRKSVFPSALLETYADKTTNKTTEVPRKETQGQVRSLFGNLLTTKRKNMFADFIVSESEDEVPEIQPRIFGFPKKPETKRRGTSSSHALTDAEDEWKMLPSSTMMEHMEGLNSPVKRPKLSTIPKDRGSEGIQDVLMLTDDENIPANKQPPNKTYNKSKSLSHVIVDNNPTSPADEEVINNMSLPMEIVRNDSEAENVLQQIANTTKHTEQLIQKKTQTINTADLQKPFEQVTETKTNDLRDKSSNISNHTMNDQENNKSDKEATIKSDTRKSKTFIINKSDTSTANNDDDPTNIAQDEPKNISNESEPEDVMKVTYDETETEENEQGNQINVPLAVIAEASNERDPESMEISNNKSKRTVEDSQNKTSTPESNNTGTVETQTNKKEDKQHEADRVFDEVITETADPNEEKIQKHRKIEHSIETIADPQNEEEIEEADSPLEEFHRESEVDDDIEDENDVLDSEPEEDIASDQETDDKEQSSHNEDDSVEIDKEDSSVHEVSEEEEEYQEEIEEHQEELEEQSDNDDNENQELEQSEASQVVDSDENDDPINNTESDNEQNQSISENDNLAEDVEVENQETTNNEEIPESPNATHDTTGRNRNRNKTKLKSPEALLRNKTHENDSYHPKERRTSIRKTKTPMHSSVNRDSLGSSAEGSGWDSHRTTRKTIRQTFGKDFTPRKSLRALVMEKNAKRQTDNLGYPQANSTETEQNFTVAITAADITPANEDSTLNRSDPKSPYMSGSINDTTLDSPKMNLETYLEKIRRDNEEMKQKAEEAVKEMLAPPNYDKYRGLIKRQPRKSVATKPKVSKSKPSAIRLGTIPEEILQDMKYKPPKRFMKKDASWIGKRLYTHLESKLEPKYDYGARVKAEKLVEHMYHFTKYIKKLEVAPQDSINELKIIMARLNIVRTHNEFYEFFWKFMPREVRIKVVPDITNNLPLPKNGIFNEIIPCGLEF